MRSRPCAMFASALGRCGVVFCRRSTKADEPLVFISSFAAGKDGAIEAFRLDTKTGRLTHLHRAASVENPYFMAVSPDQKFLYAIHAKEFGGKEHEQVAAYAIVASDRPVDAVEPAVDPRLRLLLSARRCDGQDAAGGQLLDRQRGVAAGAGGRLVGRGGVADATSRLERRCRSPRKVRTRTASWPVPDNRFACAADLGLDQVLVYRLDAAKAKLSPHDKPPAQTPRAPGRGIWRSTPTASTSTSSTSWATRSRCSTTTRNRPR